MENLTEILTQEHKHILQVIQALEKETTALEQGKGIDQQFFTKAIDFIRNYADKFHHAKEEEILFKEMDNSLEEMHCDPREQMLYEHNQGREFVKNLELAVQNLDKQGVITNARGYATLLQEHIYKEDNILYPMADTAIPHTRQQYMLGLAKKTEYEHFKGTKDRYLSIAKEFEGRKY